MDLTLEDFNDDFINSEIHPVKLETMGGRSVYLRSLGRADITRFQRISDEILGRVGMNIVSPPDLASRIMDTDIADAEDYLVFKALCDKSGEPFLPDLKSYMKWTGKVKNVAIDEILVYIKKNMIVFYNPDEDTKEHEKKSES